MIKNYKEWIAESLEGAPKVGGYFTGLGTVDDFENSEYDTDFALTDPRSRGKANGKNFGL